MTQFITADTIICQSLPGTCVYTLAQIPPDAEETAFLIREQSGIIADLGKHPPIQVRAGLFPQSRVTLLPILISISGELYETWLNYHAEEYAQPALAALCIQDRFSFHFYDDHRRRIRACGRAACLRWRRPDRRRVGVDGGIAGSCRGAGGGTIGRRAHCGRGSSGLGGRAPQPTGRGSDV